MLDKYKYIDIIYANLFGAIGLSESHKRSSRVSVHLFCWESYLITLKKIIAGKNNGTLGRRGRMELLDRRSLN
jgi:hypothetical protein